MHNPVLNCSTSFVQLLDVKSVLPFSNSQDCNRCFDNSIQVKLKKTINLLQICFSNMQFISYLSFIHDVYELI
jgi:hypothetical protein